MISSTFNVIVYNPLYNGLIALIGIVPWADVGVVVIIFTVIIKLILFPLAQKSVKTQVAVRAIEPEIKKIRDKRKNDKEAQARETMALYKKYNINPFSGFLLILIQLPIIFALYFIFLRGGLPMINTEILYSFVGVPSSIDVKFLGFLDVTQDKVISLALLTALSQYIQARLVAPPAPKGKSDGSLKDSFARSMQLQMRYVMPIIVGFIAYSLPAVIALYWITSNIFTIGQEFFVRRKHESYSSTKGSSTEGISSPTASGS